MKKAKLQARPFSGHDRWLVFLKVNLLWFCVLAVTAVLLYGSVKAQEKFIAAPVDYLPAE